MKKPTPKRIPLAIRNAAVNAFKKDYTALKHYLLGKGYFSALSGLALAETYHVGTRKNGYTPEFHHQVIIAWTIINLRGLEGPWRSDRGLTLEEHCVLLAFLHDVMEDYGLSREEITSKFGQECSDDVYALSKKHRDFKKTPEQYAIELSKKPARIIVKGADRSHNIQSMHGGFKPEKIEAYLIETKTVNLPMLKLGRRSFPEYHFAFTGLSFMLKRQVELYDVYVADRKTAIEAHNVQVAQAIRLRTDTHVKTMDELRQERNASVSSLTVKNEHLAQQLAFERSSYGNMARALSIELSKIKDQDLATTIWNGMVKASAEQGKQFALPSMLGAVDESKANFSGLSGAPDQQPAANFGGDSSFPHFTLTRGTTKL